MKCVFQAITKAVGDAGIHITEISKRHNELSFRENQGGADVSKVKELRETVETELKHLHQVLSEISQEVNTSQDAMERCIFSTDANLDSTFDSTADWDADTIDDAPDSYDKLDQLTSNFSDSEDKEIELESPNEEVSPPSSSPISMATQKMSSSSPKTKALRTTSKRKKTKEKEIGKEDKPKAQLDAGDKKKRMKRSKSAKKLKSTSKSAPLKRQASAELKTDLSQLDKEQLLEMALKLKDTEDKTTKTVRTTSSSPPNSPHGGSGMSKKLKHRIPSKTRLRIAPLG